MMVNFDDLVSRREKIAVVGLGYVGLPLAVHLSKHFDIIGFDLKTQRINWQPLKTERSRYRNQS
jgi:UDP-N-acetyl-D-galactosamine dehydrogenase